jgi:hypothetical protein
MVGARLKPINNHTSFILEGCAKEQHEGSETPFLTSAFYTCTSNMVAAKRFYGTQLSRPLTA